jgi:hypothetical protein
MRRLAAAIVAIGFIVPLYAQNGKLTLPNKDNSVRFAVLGDTGTGGSEQAQIAAQMAAYRKLFPFDTVLLLGDNLYGGEGTRDYQRKFEIPYKALLDAGVKFYAALGNHDNPNQRMYKPFNMNGERYYTFKKGGLFRPGGPSVQFFALDSNYMDDAQINWLKKEPAASGADWKIAFFHHPIYSSGERHGSHLPLREKLEPIFLEHGVDVVFAGHEHFYERLKPQKGIHYFILGNSAKLRRGNIGANGLTAKGFDEGYAFMLVEIDGDQFHFQTIDQNGRTVDSGSFQRTQRQTSNRP